MNKIKLLGQGISIGSKNDFENTIVHFAQLRVSKTVFVANVHMLVEAVRDRAFGKIFNEADIVTPDGMPLCHALKFLHHVEQERMAGMDLLSNMLEKAEQNNISVFFYGSTPETLAKIQSKCVNRYKNLTIAGAYSPPFRPLTETEQTESITLINDSKAGMVFVALGCPKQEQWMALMKGKINAVMLGVGGAFPVFAEEIKRCPVWMQKYSLEWFYRLIQEPQRLWKRYLITNSYFIYLFCKQVLLKKIVQ
jgi:N-acetylglucosaminyldiphosphoundecaprenol N-acetyl-beta-D-mannosaminyltransferase